MRRSLARPVLASSFVPHMRSIAFLLDDSNVHGADLTDPMLGNPAVGGTEYAFVSLAHELASRPLARVTLLHRNRANAYPKTLNVVPIDDRPDGLRSSLNQVGPIDCVILRGHDSMVAAGVLDS